MSQVCNESVKMCRVRITSLNQNGSVAPEPNNSYVTDKAISVAATGDIQQGNESTLVGGCGQIIGTFKDQDRLKRFNMSLILGAPEPSLTSMLLGAPIVLDDADVPVGFSWPVNVCPDDAPPPCVAVEAWSYAWDCDHQATGLPYWYWVWPQAYFSPSNQFTLDNNLLQLEWAGYTQSNPLWGHGPYGGAVLLEPQGGVVQVADAPPESECGWQSVTPGS